MAFKLQSPRASYTVSEFCAAERISRVALYDFWKQGKGPRFYMNGEMQAHHDGAELEWQREMEARVENQEVSDAA